MSLSHCAPYGTWKSPITSATVVAETVSLSDPFIDAQGIAWQEGRPSEKGRVVLVRQGALGPVEEITPAPFNVRTRVHEYGGRSYLVTPTATFFCHFADQRIYRIDPGQAARAITPDTGAALRYADLQYDASRGLLVAVREDHRLPGEAANTLVQLNALGDNDGGQVIASGCDFYAAPRLSPDGQHLAWLQWRHPDMPWDGTELMLAALSREGQPTHVAAVAGSRAEAVCLPQWSPQGELHFVSDRSGWWNLYRWQNGQALNLAPMAAEWGLAHWNFGASTYAFESDTNIVCSFVRNGLGVLARLNTATGALSEVATDLQWFSGLQAWQGQVVFIGASPTQEPSLCTLRGAQVTTLQRGSSLRADPAYTALPQPFEFASTQGRPANALFYPPRNADFCGPADEKPPLLVLSHGGPTSAAQPVFKAALQYWTSRGFAVLDVNYGGSTGYGRAYREQLKGQWGVVDVDDCVHGALALARQGLVDPKRLIIRGGSAGGYTTLAALAFRQVFACGASHYGIGDLEALARDTHKFEARYLDSLIGPYPERSDLYRERSPIHHAEGLSCPLILFQGGDDRVVPPEQSRQMHAAVKAKGLPVAYIEFAGEGHGFRQAANICRALDAEAYFYAQVFGFKLADKVEPVAIDNLA